MTDEADRWTITCRCGEIYDKSDDATHDCSPEPMTDDDLVNISHRLACRYVFRDEDTGEMWIDGGALQRVDIEALLAEVRRLRAIERVARNAARHPEDGGDRIMWALLYGEGVTDAH